MMIVRRIGKGLACLGTALLCAAGILALPGEAAADTVSASGYDAYYAYRFTSQYTGIVEFNIRNDNMYKACISLRDSDDVTVGVKEVDCPDGRVALYWDCVKGETYTMGVYESLYDKNSAYATTITMEVHSHKWVLNSTNPKTHAVSYICEGCQRSLNGCVSVAPSVEAYTYNGNARKPSAVITNTAGVKIPASSYTVTYGSGRKSVGKYTMKVTFKGDYAGLGTISTTFLILPAKTCITSIKGQKKQFYVKWKKKTVQTSGYQVQYSKMSSFKVSKIYRVKSNSITKLTVGGLPSGQKYYVRVRAYKLSGNHYYYSGWSAVKTVKTE